MDLRIESGYVYMEFWEHSARGIKDMEDIIRTRMIVMLSLEVSNKNGKKEPQFQTDH